MSFRYFFFFNEAGSIKTMQMYFSSQLRDTFAKGILLDTSIIYFTLLPRQVQYLGINLAVIIKLLPDSSSNIDGNNSGQYWSVSLYNVQKQTIDNKLIKQNSLKLNFQISELRNKGRYCSMFAQGKNCEVRRDSCCQRTALQTRQSLENRLVTRNNRVTGKRCSLYSVHAIAS